MKKFLFIICFCGVLSSQARYIYGFNWDEVFYEESDQYGLCDDIIITDHINRSILQSLTVGNTYYFKLIYSDSTCIIRPAVYTCDMTGEDPHEYDYGTLVDDFFSFGFHNIMADAPFDPDLDGTDLSEEEYATMQLYFQFNYTICTSESGFLERVEVWDTCPGTVTQY